MKLVDNLIHFQPKRKAGVKTRNDTVATTAKGSRTTPKSHQPPPGDQLMDYDDLSQALPQIGQVLRTLLTKNEDLTTRVGDSLSELKRTNDSILMLSQKVTKLENDQKKLAKGVITNDGNIRELYDQVDNIEQNSLNLQLVLTCDLPQPEPVDTPEITVNGEGQSETVRPIYVSQLARLKEVQNRVRQHLTNVLALPETTFDNVSVRPLSKRASNKYHLTFPDVITKMALFDAKKRRSPSGLYIQDFLTRSREELLYNLRRMKNVDKKLSAVYSRNGNIYVKFPGNDTASLVRNLNDIARY